MSVALYCLTLAALAYHAETGLDARLRAARAERIAAGLPPDCVKLNETPLGLNETDCLRIAAELPAQKRH